MIAKSEKEASIMKNGRTLIVFVGIMICALAPVLTFAKTCSAMSPDMFMGEFSLGGIWIGMPYEELVGHYGEPQRTEKGNTEMVKKRLYYGNSVEISLGYTAPQRDTVIGISVGADNGWATPAGVRVGMSRRNVRGLYGTPDSVTSPNRHNAFYTDTYVYKEKRPAGFWRGRPMEEMTSRSIQVFYATSGGDSVVRKITIFKEEFGPYPAG